MLLITVLTDLLATLYKSGAQTDGKAIGFREGLARSIGYYVPP